MSELFRLITTLTYWVLIVLWSFILCFYVRRMWHSKTQQLFPVLILILAIDAFRTVFESVYFGTWCTSQSGIIPASIDAFLMRPEFVIILKVLNVIAAILVIALLLKRWIPEEESAKVQMGEALHQTMPGMTGAELSLRLLEMRSDIPIILCSGYSIVISEEKALSMEIKKFALKPITL